MGKKVKYGVSIIIMLILIILYSFVDKSRCFLMFKGLVTEGV